MEQTVPFEQHMAPVSADSSLIHRTKGDERQRALVQAAFEVIAQRGLEGLRTREIAAQAGMNVAMVHYYFANKEALIAAVVEFLVEQFLRYQTSPVSEGEDTPLHRLRRWFANARTYQQDHPKLAIVYQEVFQRSRRDSSLLPMLQSLDQRWYANTKRMLDDGVQQGIFRATLNVEQVTKMIMAQLRGAYLTTLEPLDFDQAYSAFERLLTTQKEVSCKRRIELVRCENALA
jgi:AcrR family transcriptional regulator